MYPDTLSADLTSKRTSHKLAEQGRRNRINTALADLAKLLAPDVQAPSKATTVEMAIREIQKLQTDLAEYKQRLSRYEDVTSTEKDLVQETENVSADDNDNSEE